MFARRHESSKDVDVLLWLRVVLVLSPGGIVDKITVLRVLESLDERLPPVLFNVLLPVID